MAALRLARAETRLQAEPHDLDAWDVVLSVADNSPLAEGRPLYERFLAQFPCAAIQWKALVDSELRAREFAAAEAHLGRCLRACPHLSLWNCYITFVRLTTNDDTAKLIEAYELLLDAVGFDVGAAAHWLDYISLLKSRARTEPKLVVQVRAAYQRALVLPLNKLDVLWKEYEAWETFNNRTLGRQLVAEWQDRHRIARREGRERAALRAAAPLDAPGRPPCSSDSQLVAGWRAYLEFEISGALKLPPADQVVRLTLAFEQALLPLRLYAEAYHHAARTCAKAGQIDAARTYWRRGADVLPGCALLPLAEAEFEERAGNLDGAAAVYDRLTAGSPGPLVWVHALRFVRRTRGPAAARALFARARRAPSAGWQVYAVAAALEAAAVPEGAGAEADAASQIAVNIFEKGLAPFGCELAYVRVYAEFLKQRGRLDDLRSLYERTLARVDEVDDGGALGAPSAEPIPAAQLCGLWDAYVSLEKEFGSMAAVRALEVRRAARHPDAADPLSMAALAARLRYGGLLPCSEEEAAMLGLDVGLAADPTALGFAPARALGAPPAPPAGALGASAGAQPLGGALGSEGHRGVEPHRRQQPPRAEMRARGPRGAGAAEGEGAAAPEESLGELESQLLARKLNAPEQITILMAALPAPAEFSGPVPSPAEVNRLLEVLVQLPPNLHSLVGTAVRLFGGSMDGTPAASRAQARAGPASASAIDSSGAAASAAAQGRAAAAVDAPATRLVPSPPLSQPPLGLDVKPEPVSVRPGASASVAPASKTAPLAAASAALDDSNDSDDDAPAFRRKRAGDNDLYLQRLHKKQNAQS